jgi:hypothetical protein
VALAAGDCERLHDGLVAQPVNTASALAYVAVGALLVGRGLRAGPGGRPVPGRGGTVAFGLAVAAAGVGSVDFHGPGSPAARFLHDAGLCAAVSFVAVHDLARLAGARRLAVPAWAATAGAGGLLLGLLPRAGGALAGALGLLVGAGEVAVARRRPRGGAAYRAGVAALAVGAACWWLGRTGGPLCDPDSPLQGHAAWHLLTASALTAWAQATLLREAAA